MSQLGQPHILVLPSGALAEEILTPRAWDVLESLGTVERNGLGRMPTSEELAERLPRATAVMTSWGTPPFDDAMLAAAPQLRIIGHAAGSIRRLTPPPVFARGIVVTHGADVIAQSVGEWALTTTLMALRAAHTFDRAMQSGRAWSGIKGPVGAGTVPEAGRDHRREHDRPGLHPPLAAVQHGDPRCMTRISQRNGPPRSACGVRRRSTS